MKYAIAAVLFLGLTSLAPAQAGSALRVEAVSIQRSVTTGSLTGEVQLNQPAPDNQVWVELSSEGPLHAPMAVRVPAGESHVRFNVAVDPVEQDTTCEVRAYLRGQGPSQLVHIQGSATADR